MSEPQVHIEERFDDADAGYRGDPSRTVLELTRPALDPAVPGLSHSWKTVGVGALLLICGALIVLGATFKPFVSAMTVLYVGLGTLFLLLGGLLVYLHVATRLASAARRRDWAQERPDDVLRVRVDADGVHAAPRQGERSRWSGRARTEGIARVFGERGETYHRVRVELAGGESVTLLDGIEAAAEAEAIVERVRARLSRNARRK